MRVESKTATTVRPVKLFFSYAHRDEEFREELGRHLAFLWRSRQVDPWHDRKITAGQDWAGEIDRHLREADIILLLVSADFADSDYCWDVEMQTAFIRHELGEATVVPVIVRQVAGWETSPLGALQALPTDAEPVSSWDDRDEAYMSIVRGLQEIIKDRQESKCKRPAMVEWKLATSGDPQDYAQERLDGLARRLRKVTSNLHIMPVGIERGSVRLRFLSTQAGYQAVRRLYDQGMLEKELGIPIDAVISPIGATLRIEARTVTSDAEILATIVSPEPIPPEDLIWPPFVTGLSYPVDDFLKLGFLLGRHPDHEPSQNEIAALQARLGRYLNTMLVVSGDNLNVNLSPYKDWGGLTQPLRGTELGRDLLAQDLELKRQVARLLYPGDSPGERFWSEVEKENSGGEIGTFLRVWIVPGQAAIKEALEDGMAHVKIERMRLRVLCEIDYTLLRSGGGQGQVSPSDQDRIAEVFRTSVMTETQRMVDTAPQFGLLRQIYSVLILAKWIKERVGTSWGNFIDSDDTTNFQVPDAEPDAHRIQREYTQLFERGGFRYPVRRVDSESGMVVHRIYIAGAINLGLCAVLHSYEP